jgi:hypothetical protein
VVINRTTIIKTEDIHFYNARLPRAILTAPADKFGRERIRASVETRYRDTDLTPVRGELPLKPSRASLFGGAPKGVSPPSEIVSRSVVSTRMPRERDEPWKDEALRLRTQAVPESRFVIPPARRAEDSRELPRPPFGAEAGPERTPPPRPPRYEEMRKSVTPPPVTTRSPSSREQEAVRVQDAPRSPGATRGQAPERREARPAPRPATPTVIEPPSVPPVSRPAVSSSEQTPRGGGETVRGEARQEREKSKDKQVQQLPGQPANQTYRGRDQGGRDAR